MANYKKRFGDRKDARLLREADSMHKFTPYLLPGRIANEATMSELTELTAINEYLAKKNADNPEFKYTLFHVICAAIAKTVVLRPKMNYFISGKKMYERDDISFSFVVKKKFADNGAESLCILRMDRESDIPPIEQFYTKLKKFVYTVRKEDKQDGTTDVMDILTSLPSFITSFITRILFWLDRHGKLPDALLNEDPYSSTVFISNLGSIKMSADYHHLTNWGTNSIFVLIGEKKLYPFYDENGNVTMKEAVPTGWTIDERIADGFYFANSIKVLRSILEHPEVLEMPLSAPLPDFNA